MKKAISLITILVILAGVILAGSPAKCLGGSYPEEAHSIQQTIDGGYIVAGYTRSNDGDVSGSHGRRDSWIVKLNEKGELEWQKCLGGSDDDWAYSIQQTKDGGYIIASWTKSNDGNVSGNHGGWDYWIVKLNEKGELEWQKCLGGSDDDMAYSIQQTSDGGYIVAGRTESNDGDVSGNHGGWDYWIVKLNEKGELEWQKCLGGSDDDMALSIQQTSDRGYIVAGETKSNDGDVSGFHGGYGGGDSWIVKLNEKGELQWQKCLGGSIGEIAHSIQQTSDEGYIVAGETWSHDGDVSGCHSAGDYWWIVKLNNKGELEWQKCLGGLHFDVAQSIQQTSDEGYIVAGYTQSNDGDISGNHGSWDYWIVKLNYNGELEWQKCLGGSDEDKAHCIQQTSDGGYIVAGFTESNDGDVSGNHGYADYWIVKLETE